jgi:hypothetical protein
MQQFFQTMSDTNKLLHVYLLIFSQQSNRNLDGRFMIELEPIKKLIYLGGDLRNFANFQIVNETANTMLQQCRLS